jgi:hypothetical protein
MNIAISTWNAKVVRSNGINSMVVVDVEGRTDCD